MRSFVSNYNNTGVQAIVLRSAEDEEARATRSQSRAGPKTRESEEVIEPKGLPRAATTCEQQVSMPTVSLLIPSTPLSALDMKEFCTTLID